MKFWICWSCCSLWLQIFWGHVCFLGGSFATHLWVIEWRQKYSALAKIKACFLSGFHLSLLTFLGFEIKCRMLLYWIWQNKMFLHMVWSLKTNMSHWQQCFLTRLFQCLGTVCQLLCPTWWSPLCLCTAFVVAVWTAPLLGWLMLTLGALHCSVARRPDSEGSHAVVLFTSNELIQLTSDN